MRIEVLLFQPLHHPWATYRPFVQRGATSGRSWAFSGYYEAAGVRLRFLGEL